MDTTQTTETPAISGGMTGPATTPKPKRVRVLKTPTKPTVKAKPAKAVAPESKPAAAPKVTVNQHVEAGVNVASYGGLSSFVNANRKAAVMVAPARSTSKLTERHQKALYALRGAYNGKSWGAQGFDNGVLRDLLAAGLIELSGGITEVIDGKTYHIDGPTPLRGKLTAAGLKYGVVAAK